MRTPTWWSASPEGLPFDRRGKPPSGQTGRRLFRALPPAGRNALPRRSCCPLATGNSDRVRRASAGPRVRRPHPSRRTTARGPDVTEAGREAADEAARPVRLFEEIRDALLLATPDARPFLLRHRRVMNGGPYPTVSFRPQPEPCPRSASCSYNLRLLRKTEPSINPARFNPMGRKFEAQQRNLAGAPNWRVMPDPSGGGGRGPPTCGFPEGGRRACGGYCL